MNDPKEGSVAPVPPSRVAIIGVGLIGGSLARALKRAGECVTGYDTDPMALRRA